MTGNCLKGSRPLLSFDENFITHTHYSLLKELLTQIFGVPNYHPKSQPFFDHVYTFSILDNRIWFRNFQILTEDGALAEIGPRFVLNPVKIFSGSFGSDTLWDNPNYISPAKVIKYSYFLNIFYTWWMHCDWFVFIIIYKIYLFITFSFDNHWRKRLVINT